MEGRGPLVLFNPLWPENFDLQNNFLSLGSSFFGEIRMKTTERKKRFKVSL